MYQGFSSSLIKVEVLSNDKCSQEKKKHWLKGAKKLLRSLYFFLRSEINYGKIPVENI